MYSGKDITNYSIFEGHFPVFYNQPPPNGERPPAFSDAIFLHCSLDAEQNPLSAPTSVPVEPCGMSRLAQALPTSTPIFDESSLYQYSLFESLSFENFLPPVFSPPYAMADISNQSHDLVQNSISADRDAIPQFSLTPFFWGYTDSSPQDLSSSPADILADAYLAPFLGTPMPCIIETASSEDPVSIPNGTSDIAQYTTIATASESSREMHPCQLCGISFGRNEDLRRHSGRCSTKLTCMKCGAKLSRKQDLRRHDAARHGGQQPRRYDCRTCGRFFTRADSLRRHRSSRCSKDRTKNRAMDKKPDVVSSPEINKLKPGELLYKYAFVRSRIKFQLPRSTYSVCSSTTYQKYVNKKCVIKIIYTHALFVITGGENTLTTRDEFKKKSTLIDPNTFEFFGSMTICLSASNRCRFCSCAALPAGVWCDDKPWGIE